MSLDGNDTALPIACNLDALSGAERAERARLARELESRVTGVSETESGYRVALLDDGSSYDKALALILLERRCCPFLTLRLEFTPAQGPAYLDISGPEGTKAVLAESGLFGCGARCT